LEVTEKLDIFNIFTKHLSITSIVGNRVTLTFPVFKVLNGTYSIHYCTFKYHQSDFDMYIRYSMGKIHLNYSYMDYFILKAFKVKVYTNILFIKCIFKHHLYYYYDCVSTADFNLGNKFIYLYCCWGQLSCFLILKNNVVQAKVPFSYCVAHAKGRRVTIIVPWMDGWITGWQSWQGLS